MSREAVSWVFNLDAEDELKRTGPHTPTQATRQRVQALLPQLASLMKPEDEVLWPASARSGRARLGRAWCPTPWALAEMKRAGLAVPTAPPVEALRRVNHRKFAQDLGQAMPGARFVESEAELLEALADDGALAAVSIERNWLMKHALGYAGRGRRKIAPGRMSSTDRTWIQAALVSGDGLQLEPFVAREIDFAIHGDIEAGGEYRLGRPTAQSVDASGRWSGSELASPEVLRVEERRILEQTAQRTAEALIDAGYFGPFGIDAFRWRAPDGSRRFQPRCEINARYSMGWSTGFASHQGEAQARAGASSSSSKLTRRTPT